MEQENEINLLKANVDSLQKAQGDLLRYIGQVQANVKEQERYLKIVSGCLFAAAILNLVSLFFK